MITSISNERIKEISKLNITKYRKDSDYFLVEGEHLIEEAYKNDLLIEVFSILDVSYDVPVTMVSLDVMKKISALDTPSNIIGLCKKKKELPINGNVLMLDNIQDPGNLGTIIRSAVAFNIDTIVLSLDTVDLYNPKVIRSTQGMLFNINIITSDLNDVISFLKKEGYKIYSTNVVNGSNVKDIEIPLKYAIIMGNEGKGVKEELQLLSDENIYIGMNEKCESLNVGVAASIILYELDK